MFIHENWAVGFPVWYAKYLYKKSTGKKLNLKNPKDFNEKIQWLKIYSDTTQWTELADKYKVREYVKKCGLENILVKLYGVWERADEIDFNKLPDKFVLKTNNSFGKNILVYDKSELDIDNTRRQLNKWVKEKYGLITFEPHYWNIPRRIIAEEFLLDNSTAHLSSSLVDYKLNCFHGEPYYVQVLYNRNNKVIGLPEKDKLKKTQLCVYDADWKFLPFMMVGSFKNENPVAFPKPICFEEMKNICRKLAKPFPHVRVDLYVVNNKIYLGELTFTPGGGMNYFPPEIFLKMGEKMDLSAVKRRTSRGII